MPQTLTDRTLRHLIATTTSRRDVWLVDDSGRAKQEQARAPRAAVSAGVASAQGVACEHGRSPWVFPSSQKTTGRLLRFSAAS